MNPFDAMYDGVPPWEIGRPQPAFVRLAAAGSLRGRVLDIGCGSGENALFVASLGLEVLGVDASPKAITLARGKASLRGSTATFQVGDALRLQDLEHSYDTVIDCGLFHMFTDEGRLRYVSSVGRALKPGSTLFVLCFSEREPAWGGPRRITRRELETTFTGDWAVESIESERFSSHGSTEGARAWLASIVYVGKRLSSNN